MTNIIREPEPDGLADLKQKGITIALAGNPNSGKTTVFNALTGARQHVANYPGVTVEKKQGVCRHGHRTMTVVDLPGAYSLTPYSVEERVARDYLVRERPDVVVNVVDAGNLERNLYLTVQLMELGVPLVVVLNMSDVAAQRGIVFDLDRLTELLGVPIVPTVGHKEIGRQEVLNAVEQVLRHGQAGAVSMDYGPAIEAEITALCARIEESGAAIENVPARWQAIKLLEGDGQLMSGPEQVELLAAARAAVRRIEANQDSDWEALLASARYRFIGDACLQSVRSTVEPRTSFSDRIDAVVTHRVLGLPIFLAMMYAVFQLTFTLGEPPMEWIETGFAWLSEMVSGWWPEGSESLLRSLLADGVIGGVGGVLVFLPNILLLFLAIAILEDSGYLARAAFLMDRLMHKLGLHGKSFVPMLIGFGCSVPAIMATRTLENRRDRLTTMMVVPLMSCGARLPIYALIIPAFFPHRWQTPVLWGVYLVGIVLAVVCAKLLKATVLRGEIPPFVMELPPYRMPTFKSVGLHMYNRGGAYLKKAGTIILGISMVLWAMQQWPGLPAEKAASFQQQRSAITLMGDMSEDARTEQLSEIDRVEAEAALENSLMGRIGRTIEPILAPCGFDWKISTAMIGAFAAKEVFVSQMGIVYSLGEEQDEESEPLRDKLQANYTLLQGVCIMLFCLISAPCMATIAVTRRESNSWGWALAQLTGLTLLAWGVTAVVYQVGCLFVSR